MALLFWGLRPNTPGCCFFTSLLNASYPSLSLGTSSTSPSLHQSLGWVSVNSCALFCFFVFFKKKRNCSFLSDLFPSTSSRLHPGQQSWHLSWLDVTWATDLDSSALGYGAQRGFQAYIFWGNRDLSSLGLPPCCHATPVSWVSSSQDLALPTHLQVFSVLLYVSNSPGPQLVIPSECSLI